VKCVQVSVLPGLQRAMAQNVTYAAALFSHVPHAPEAHYVKLTPLRFWQALGSPFARDSSFGDRDSPSNPLSVGTEIVKVIDAFNRGYQHPYEDGR